MSFYKPTKQLVVLLLDSASTTHRPLALSNLFFSELMIVLLLDSACPLDWGFLGVENDKRGCHPRGGGELGEGINSFKSSFRKTACAW